MTNKGRAMATVPHIDASVRHERSLSRKLSQTFIETWVARRPGDKILCRNVGYHPPPFVTESWIAAAFSPPGARALAMTAELAPSDACIDELEQADLIVMGTPMYNYGMPAHLKAWFDQVIRVGRTFSFDFEAGGMREGWRFPVGYDLKPDQMRALGLHVSDPRSPEKTDRPFAEPGVFAISPDGNVQIIDVSNAPFCRLDLEVLLGGMQFVMNKD